MKKVLFILVAVAISTSVFSQTADKNSRTVLQRVIVDVGATPFQFDLSDIGTLKSLNFGLGYEVSKRLDLRFNLDVNAYINQTYFGQFSENSYRTTRAISIGANYSILNDFNFIYKQSSLELIGKFGADINDSSTQESLLFDLGLRLKMLDLPYVGLGFRHHLNDFGNMTGIYLNFGLEF